LRFFWDFIVLAVFGFWGFSAIFSNIFQAVFGSIFGQFPWPFFMQLLMPFSV